jgi:hypothetical protein
VFPGDDVFTFTAAESGEYLFSTYYEAGDADGDSIISILDGHGCTGDELACNDDFFGFLPAEVVLPLTAGQEISIVASGSWLFADGLQIWRIGDIPSCTASTTLAPTAPQQIIDSNVGQVSTASRQCDGFGNGKNFSFTPAVTGVYEIDATGTSFEPSLSVRKGDCIGQELTCTGEYKSEPYRTAVALEQGESVTITVDSQDGSEGEIQLAIKQLPERTCCNPEVLGTTLPQVVVGHTGLGHDDFLGECAYPNRIQASPESVFIFTAPKTSRYSFRTTGLLNTILYALDGNGCEAPMLRCMNDWDEEYGLQGDVEDLQLEAGQTITLVVDGEQVTSGSFVLTVSEYNPGVSFPNDSGVAP